MSSPLFTIHWGKYQGYDTATIRDQSGYTIPVINDYIDHLAELHFRERKTKSSSKSEIEPTVYTLSALFQFLRKMKLSLAEINDELLEKFRDAQLEVVKNNPRNRNQSASWYQTVNRQLVIIYECLNWGQTNGLLPVHTIGNANIASVASTRPRLENGGTDYDNKPKNKYPLRYKRKAAGKTRALQHWATDDEILAIDKQFWAIKSMISSTRNSLMLTLMETVGFRISSSNSLMVDQFSAKALVERENADEYIIVPPVQKGGLDFPFPIPWELAHAIRAYCDDDVSGRKAILRITGVDESVAKHAVFLSLTKGSPLLTRSWVDIFSKAFKATGAPKGAGSHAIRRKFLDDIFVAEIEYRQSAKLPVSLEDVAAAVMEKAGHSTKEAQQSYLRATTRIAKGSLSERLNKQLAKVRVENHELHAELASALAALKDEREKNAALAVVAEQAQLRQAPKAPRKKKDQSTTS
ncbi:hypothetical protein [Herbaspirillum sp. 1130]|uniref:hypothetical protein n=1 Tax=Herbaspirillum sp. 1130 TaxID=2806562 RepID=UPI001AE94397|nr:hypothetical protein [Herbaspirillum sp. 1130]MBP1312809.1 integrase [Herbaspirillum sp. 1130]